jgi:ribosomal protein S18 acetylase RimI-like enzyme
VIVRHATDADLTAVEALRRADGDALGFVPRQKYEHIVMRTLDRGRRRWLYEWLLVSEDNGDVTGFVLAGFHRDGAKIEQICVRSDARRMERAMSLAEAIEVEAVRRGSRRLRCRVAFDLDANFFWQALGYTAVATTTSTWLNLRESQSKRPLIVYDKALDQLALFGQVAVDLEEFGYAVLLRGADRNAVTGEVDVDGDMGGEFAASLVLGGGIHAGDSGKGDVEGVLRHRPTVHKAKAA